VNKKTGIILAVVIANIVLVGTVVTLYYTVFQKDDQVEEGKLIITGLVDQQINLTLVDLELMPNITQQYVLVGTPTINAEYTGVSLAYLVVNVANVSENYKIGVIPIDNYPHPLLTLNDVLTHPDIIIAYKKNGEYLKPRTEGGNGPYRLIIPLGAIEDHGFNGQYCMKYVVEINIYE